MSLLSICQGVSDVVGFTRPTAIISSMDQIPRQCLGFAKETLIELSKMDWPVLQVPYTFNTVPGQAAYDLPVDFAREIGDSVYGAARYSQVRGSLTPADWARQRNVLPGLGFYRFRIFGNPMQLNLTPTPQVAESIVFEYQTTYRVRQISGDFKTTFYADDDVTVVDEDLMVKGLKWRMRRAKGMDYSEEFDDYEIDRAQTLAQAMQLGSLPVATRSPYYEGELGMGYIPESGFG